MFLGEPGRTAYDLHFSVAGFRVRVHPFFWVLTLILGLRGDEPEIGLALLWVAVVFVSILVHELGHTLAFRYYGIDSHIVLYHFGGIAIPDGKLGSFSSGTRLSSGQNIVVSAAGPVAGFLLASLVIAIVYATGERVTFEAGLSTIIRWNFSPGMFANLHLINLVHSLLFVNIFWGLLNLLPIYPLDGGQISRELFLLHDSGQGIVRSLWLSVLTGGGLAIWFIVAGERPHIFGALMFGALAYSSYQALQGYTGGGRFGGGAGRGPYGGQGGSPW